MFNIIQERKNVLQLSKYVLVLTILNCVFRRLKILVLLHLSLCSIADCWIMSKADCKSEKNKPCCMPLYIFSYSSKPPATTACNLSDKSFVNQFTHWLSTPMVVNLLRWVQFGHGTWGSWCHCPGEGLQSKPGLLLIRSHHTVKPFSSLRKILLGHLQPIRAHQSWIFHLKLLLLLQSVSHQEPFYSKWLPILRVLKSLSLTSKKCLWIYI